MAITDVLKQLGLSLAGAGATGLQQGIEGLGAITNPLAYQQQQENLRQQRSFQAQQQLRMTMTPYEQGMLDIQKGAQARLDKEQTSQLAHQSLLDNLSLSKDRASGLIVPAQQGETGAFAGPDNQQYKYNPDVQVDKPFTWNITDEERQFLPKGTPSSITMKSSEFPAFIKDYTQLKRLSPVTLKAHGDTIKQQIGSLIDSAGADDPLQQMKQTYQYQVDDADTIEKQSAILGEIQKMREEGIRKKADLAATTSPEAIAGKAAMAGAEETARLGARQKAETSNDAEYFPGIYDAVSKGQQTVEGALSQKYTAGTNARERFYKWVKDQNLPLPTPLSSGAQADLRKLQPIIDGLEDLRNKLEPIKNENNPLYFTGDRLAYFLGFSTPLTDTINQIERDRVQGGVRVLGGVRSYQALQLAMQHLPEAWHKSPKLAYEQIDSLLRTNAYPARKDIYTFGNKYGVVQPGAPGFNINRPSLPPLPNLPKE